MKQLSEVIKKMMESANVTPKIAAACIGCTVGTFRNKMTQDRFSLNDMIILSELCDYHLALIPSDMKQPLDTLVQSRPVELLDSDSYATETTIEKLKEYRKAKLQKNLSELEKYMTKMNDEQKQKFVQMCFSNQDNEQMTLFDWLINQEK